jgi:hypothetical protein
MKSFTGRVVARVIPGVHVQSEIVMTVGGCSVEWGF